MNKRFRKLMASLVALLMTFSYITASAVAADKAPVIDHSQITVNQGISDFVTRLYDICLGRNPDPTGFKTWTEQLSNGENTGVGCAYGFIFSNEFQNKNVSNDQYIELMYNCFFGRASDPTGKSNWLNSMNAGMTREELFMGFANSTEFFNLCNEYGITAGCHIMGRDFTQTAQINLFVERLYNVILGRPCDQAGMMDWSTRLASREISGAEAAYGFVFSPEYRNKNKSDSDFLEDLYNAFMGRGSDPTGKANWLSALNNGSSDRDIFNGFTGSQEFISICNDYGIDKGGDITTGQTSARAGSGNPTTPTNIPSPNPTQPAQPTQPVTPVVTSNYDPDNHGGYWIVGTNSNLSANQTLSFQPNYRKITDGTDFTAAAQNRLGYVCTSGYVITYSQYYQMDWSQASDPMFGGKTNGSGYYRGSYWANGGVDEDTQYVATWLYGTSGASDALAYDSHAGGTNVVGMHVRYPNGTYTGQTWGYKAWNGNAVTGNDYSRWASAMDAYSSGTRHSSTILAKYGITNERLGDYIMIEWCEGNLTYNLQTLPLPDYTRYTGMGSDSAHTHFTTSTSRSTSVYFPTSKTWNYSSRSANVVPPTPTPKPAPTITGYELIGNAYDDDGNEHSNSFTGGSKSDVRSQYSTWIDNHGYIAGSYVIVAVYSDGSRKTA